MKVKGFLKDVGGASRVTKRRMAAFSSASPVPVKADPIGDVAREWHPGKIELVVTDVRPASKTSKTLRFERTDGKKLPPFYAGQYMVIDFPLGESLISRPYSISSAPFEARLDEHPFVEITVRRSKGDGFICDHINDNVKVGDVFLCSVGLGQFYYEPLRDAKNVVALAGGVGITPFASMAKEVAHGTLDMDLTILFGSVSSDDIALKEELEKLSSPRLKIVHVLSGDEPDWPGERGFLSAELIQKYSATDTTYFICGPQVMYRFLHGELDKMGTPKRRIRFEVFGQAKDITVYDGYPKEAADQTFRLTVRRGIHEDVIPAKATESIVVALERAGIRIETGCRSGECGFCRTKLLSGSVFVCPENDGRRAADKDFGYIHACAAYPTSDCSVKIPIE
ncbi:MAG: 2Fe-2S iron-sulfur cluster binding domain-containing protein [Firmicutes bacterium]|nr:2Fe-2S iron-sulfur cluster binding domain-containing protein [Bacillota bacterium]